MTMIKLSAKLARIPWTILVVNYSKGKEENEKEGKR